MSKKNAVTQWREDAPFENLFEVYKNADERKAIIEKVFRGRLEIFKVWNRDTIRFLQQGKINEVKDRCENIQKGSLQTAEQEKAAIQEKIKNFQKQIAEIQKNITELKKEVAQKDKICDHYKRVLEKEMKELKEQKTYMDQINTIALVHPTAGIEKLASLFFADIRVTKQDEGTFESIKPDMVFECSKEEELIKILPQYRYYLEKKYSISAKNSIIEYCELVAHTLMEGDDEKQVILLFNNEDIATILAENGLL